jgi:translation initiation factor IF-3
LEWTRRAAGSFYFTLGGSVITTEKRVRINRQIRISPVRVISADGQQLGIMSVDEALAAAEADGLDLVEVAPGARPPVVRIMDYGKFKYEEARKARVARKKQHQIQIKEVKFRPGIEPHDFDFKVRHARRFLDEGNKVKATMMFRGRQMAHPEHGLEVLRKVAEVVEDVGKVESQPSMEGRTMTMILAPRKTT